MLVGVCAAIASIGFYAIWLGDNHKTLLDTGFAPIVADSGAAVIELQTYQSPVRYNSPVRRSGAVSSDGALIATAADVGESPRRESYQTELEF